MEMHIKQNENHCKSSIDVPSIRSQPLSDRKRFQRQSSTQTVVSNASSKRSHRRSHVEVGSMIYGGPPQASIPMCRQKSEPIKGNIYRSSTLECRAPEDASSSCARILLSNDSEDKTVDRTMSCTASNDDDATERALYLIKKLSFETGDASSSDLKKPESVCSAPTVMVPPTCPATTENNAVFSPEHNIDMANRPEFESPSPIALPPKIQRMEDSHSIVSGSLPDHVTQIMHNRNRLRSTSLSEMSDSYRGDKGDNTQQEDFWADACSLNSFNSKSEEILLNTIENPLSPEMATSPPLHPDRVPKVPPLMNRGRTSTLASDHSSSFLSSSSSSSDDMSDEYSISSYEDELHGLDDPPGYYDGDYKSLPEYKSATLRCTAKTHFSWDHRSPNRLSLEALQEWNRVCAEEEYHNGIATKERHISRALSCPEIVKFDRVEEVGQVQVKDILPFPAALKTDEEDDEPLGLPDAPPHLMASDLPMSHAQSRSLFSYTNSYSPSTISSGLSDHMEEISHLDFDMSILYPREIEIINSPSTNDTVGLQKKRLHRRSRSSIGLSKPLNKKFSITHKRHRRNKSDMTPVNQTIDSDVTPPTKHRRLISLSNIVEDVKSLSSGSGVNSSDRNLVNILSLSLSTNDMNTSSMKETVMRACERHREKFCWFAFGFVSCLATQYFLRI